MNNEGLTRKRLFYDIETSQMTFKGWRTGKQYVGGHQILTHTKIISIHWKWEGEDKVHNLDWGLNKQCDKKLIGLFIKELNKAAEIVAHNGDRFDIKWIRTRAVKHGIEMHHSYNMIDTYKMAKKYLNLPSYSLKEICNFFDLPSKKDAGGISTWDKIQFDKDKAALDHLLFYGDGDIVSLEAVFKLLRKYSIPNMHYGVLAGGNKYDCPNCGGIANHSKRYTTTAGTQQHYMRCRDIVCLTKFKINNKTYQDWLQYKMINGIR